VRSRLASADDAADRVVITFRPRVNDKQQDGPNHPDGLPAIAVRVLV
jgi:hypothetical protein